ncbi:MAG: LysM peptidoglycan-binding domain-containing protein [Mycobacterium sp.]|mgnify:CR=1 FL=1
MKYQVQAGDTLSALAERFYGDARRHRAISAANDLANPDHLVVGQELLIPYVTYRHRVQLGDTKQQLAQLFYGDPTMSEVFEIPNGAAQRDLIVGEWLLIPDLANASGHTVVAGETFEALAERWYGDRFLWPIIAIANHVTDPEPVPGTVLLQPRLNWRHDVDAGDTLWQLAEYVYGPGGAARTRHMVQTVAGANLIDDPDVIHVGQRLYFPSFDPGD